jgi:diguanylate cyclase (GGDEF)-like protein
VRFSLRLTLFFAVTLLAIQGATIFAIQTGLRDTLMRDGEAQVAAGEARFVRQLAELQDQLAEGVRLLTLDFALRQAVAQRDAATVISVLRNHGNRVGASRMLLIAPDGGIEGDTSGDAHDAIRTFPDPALLDRAADEDRAGRVAIMGGKPVWLVVVPVMAPDLIAFVAAALPLDDAQLARIRDIAGVPGQIGIATFDNGNWHAKAGVIDADVLRQLPQDGEVREITNNGGSETIVITRALATAPGAAVVRVVLDYPLSDVLHRYRRISLVLIPILVLGLLATLAGATAISRGVARPIEALARQTKRIAEGDYATPPPLPRTDELGQLSAALGSMTRAIAEREQLVRHQATHDPVTGLANRAAVAVAIDTLAATGPGAILAIGLIRWRETTSTVGRDVGDRLLCEAAARIQRFAGGAGRIAVASIGESTFAVLLTGADQSNAMLAAARVIDAFEVPYREAELAIDAPVAVGISLLPDHGKGAAQLLRRAEVALTTAMTAETRSAVYHPETDPYRQERLSLMSDLRAGLPRGEFKLLYQPKLDLTQGRITGAEALVRWSHPTRGTMMPDDFIALAEETGNIQHLTRWALRTGLTEASRWRDQGVQARVAINLSVRDLIDDMLPTRIAGLLRESRTPARSLVLEITESAIMGEPDAAIAVLRRLDDMGIDLAIDDFGVGQSSLAYLRRLPVREIKLDKAFVLKLAETPDDQAIVRAITDLGHGLGYRVTAEGVENAHCLRLLKEFGCDYAQGYYVGRPLASASFMTSVESTHDRWAAEMPPSVSSESVP